MDISLRFNMVFLRKYLESCGCEPDLIALGSVMASALSAVMEVSIMLGSNGSSEMMLNEGHNANTFITGAGVDMALLVQLDKSVPLGWARILIQESSVKLGQVLLEEPDASDVQQNLFGNEQAGDGNNWADEIGDSLDSLWKE
ncbi:MAG: hypothetical protein HGB11_12250 [Chlorobiales bacterium]|nr:hypothetical protein [Chlorobiales bacterium]